MLGVIGGMGPQATWLFLQGVTDRTGADCDQQHIPMIILNHTTMPDRTAAILSGNESMIRKLLLKDARMLEQNGCRAIAIPCNTSHYFVDGIQAEISIPIIHMVRETVNRVAKQSWNQNWLSWPPTAPTGRGSTMKNAAAGGLRPIPFTEKAAADDEDHLRGDKARQAGQLSDFLQVEQEIRNAGCEAAILACTELSCFARQHPLPNYYIDAMDVLIDRTIQFFGKDK